MIFEIQGAKHGTNETRTFYYDNMTNTLKDEFGVVFEYPELPTGPMEGVKEYIPFSKDLPLKKSRSIQTLKIQLGLSCNYSCDYCSQKFVERAPETSKKDIDAFMISLDAMEFDEEKGLRLEFWGGEPLVYWKTLRPLVDAIKEKFKPWKKKPHYTIITNGSILNDEIIDWLMMNDFVVGMSHDGPGQSVRGPDPFDDPEQRETILGFYRMMTRLKKGFSFNAMLNSKNKSRKAIYDWFVNLTGDPNVQLGEGGIVDAYDEDGITNSLQTKQEHFEFRRQSFKDIYSTGGQIGFNQIIQKIDSFTQGVLGHADSKYLGQKCGMDSENTIAIDLRGNVLTCQNVSSLEISKNDESHLGGNIADYDNIKITTSTHWSNRKECPECPVLHLCKGACMFLDKKFWDISCANSYSDNVALFALAIQNITGFIPTVIKSPTLPLDRQDVFGTVFEHKEEVKRKIIPIKVVNEKVAVIDDVEVYGKSRIETIN